MSTDIFLQNRPFFSRVRAAAYGRARERLHQVIALFPSDGHLDREFLRAVDAFVMELEAAHEYAVDAVRGLNRLGPGGDSMKWRVVFVHHIDLASGRAGRTYRAKLTLER